MAEQLALDQGLGQGGAVQADEGLVAPGRALVQRLRHQLLADPGLAGDQHRQVAGADQVELLEHAPEHRALAQQRPAGLAGGAPVALGLQMFALGPLLQPLDARRGGDRRRGEAAKGAQAVDLGRREAARRQRVQRQQAPGLAFHLQHHPHAVMHLELALAGLDQSVVGIGQRAVGRKPGRPSGLEQTLQARMLGDAKAPAQGVRAQAVDGQRQQAVVLEPQQRDRIAGEKPPHRCQQAPVAFGRRHLLRQVGDQRHDGIEPFGWSHFYTRCSQDDSIKFRVLLTRAAPTA